MTGRETNPGTKPRYDVCIVGMKCYDHLAGNQSPRYLGGIEKDLVTLARMFVNHGLGVAMLTFDHGQPIAENIDGVDVYPCYRPDAGLPVLRFVYPRAYRVLRNIVRINAAITIVMGVGGPIAWAALAKRLRKNMKLAFLTASDSDCEADLPLVKTGHEKTLYRYGLGRSDVCFVQSAYQRAALREHFGKDGKLLRIPAYPNGLVDQYIDAMPRRHEDSQSRVLRVAWIGRLSPEKRPEWVLEIADRCSGVQFDVAGGVNTDSPSALRLVEELRSRPNVSYLGKLLPADMRNVYLASDFILNTSAKEGFPAVFRESWHFGVPVISIVDPDSLIADNRSGFAAAGIDDIVEFLNSGTATRTHAEMSDNAADMYTSEFSERRCLNTILKSVGAETVE